MRQPLQNQAGTAPGMLGLTEIPALFIKDDKPEEISLIENSRRQDLTAIEEAQYNTPPRQNAKLQDLTP